MGRIKAKPGFGRVLALKNPCYVAGTGVMQLLHKNENLLFQDFQEFLGQGQQLPQIRIPLSPSLG
jgi:hypothetical protein